MMLWSRPMSDKDLQRVTRSVSYIGQENSRRFIPTRRNHIKQKVNVAGQRTLYTSVHDDENPAVTGVKFEPSGPVAGHDHLKHCTSLPDLIGRHLLVEYCGRDEL